jgi:hypothetical protein
MNLDERSQHALVTIVQNAINERVTEHSDTHHHSKLLQHLHSLTS